MTHRPIINLDKLWTLVPAEQRKSVTASSTEVPVIDTLAAGYGKVLGKGRLPQLPCIVKARWVSALAEKKIKEAGGVVKVSFWETEGGDRGLLEMGWERGEERTKGQARRRQPCNLEDKVAGSDWGKEHRHILRTRRSMMKQGRCGWLQYDRKTGRWWERSKDQPATWAATLLCSSSTIYMLRLALSGNPLDLRSHQFNLKPPASARFSRIHPQLMNLLLIHSPLCFFFFPHSSSPNFISFLPPTQSTFSLN